MKTYWRLVSIFFSKNRESATWKWSGFAPTLDDFIWSTRREHDQALQLLNLADKILAIRELFSLEWWTMKVKYN